MSIAIFNTVGAVAGIGGIAFAVLYLTFKAIIKNPALFPQLPPEYAFRILRLLIILTFFSLAIGVSAWLISIAIPYWINNHPVVASEKRYLNQYGENNSGVEIVYPADWIEKDGGTGVPSLVPPTNSSEKNLGLNIDIAVYSIPRSRLESYSGADLADPKRDAATLNDDEFIAYIKKSTQDMIQGSVTWKGERLASVPVNSDTSPSHESTSSNAWIVDYISENTHFREFYFLEQPERYAELPEDYPVIVITCSAPEVNFRLISASCDKIFSDTTIISKSYFSD